MKRMVETGDVDIITGDWLSEMNIAWNAITKSSNPALGYEAGFLNQLSSCIHSIAKKDLRVVTNAGALNTQALKEQVEKLCQNEGLHDMVVASVIGDDITEYLKNGAKCSEESMRELKHLDHTEWSLGEWDRIQDVACGVAYIGATGIVAALNAGAHIVLCGRVTDASPVIGAAAWWYGWNMADYDQLAGALIAGRK